jgi:hypothetical protein
MDIARRLNERWVVTITLLVCLAFVLFRLNVKGWDPLGIAELGTRYSELDIHGTDGYDGQFAYYIAVNPQPSVVEPHLDVPAYRYQRILLPLLANLFSFGSKELIPWMLIVINLSAHVLGTWSLARWFRLVGHRPLYALVYGMWVGLIIPIGADLNEPLAFALIVAGWLAIQYKKPILGVSLLTLSMFAKESSSLFIAGILIAEMLTRRRLKMLVPLISGILTFLLWQVWLRSVFGQFGFASGGAMATPFEWIPFMGLLRVGFINVKALLLYIIVFGPSIVIPTIWGIYTSAKSLFRGDLRAEVWALFINAGATAFLPFSTFREPLGIVRVATGLVLAILLYSAMKKERQILNYTFFWFVLLAMLING